MSENGSNGVVSGRSCSPSSRPCAGIHREATWEQKARSHRPRHRGSRHKAGMTTGTRPGRRSRR